MSTEFSLRERLTGNHATVLLYESLLADRRRRIAADVARRAHQRELARQAALARFQAMFPSRDPSPPRDALN